MQCGILSWATVKSGKGLEHGFAGAMLQLWFTECGISQINKQKNATKMYGLQIGGKTTKCVLSPLLTDFKKLLEILQ